MPAGEYYQPQKFLTVDEGLVETTLAQLDVFGDLSESTRVPRLFPVRALEGR
jgi:hypothetical protein